MSISRHRIQPGILILALISAARVGAADQNTDAVRAQQESLYLWTAGDFEKAVAATLELYTLFPNEQRGKAAFHHAGNLLENKAAVEAQSVEELKTILERALGYFENSTRRVPHQVPAIAAQSKISAARVGAKLAKINAILKGGVDFPTASAQISECEAGRASVVYLKSQMERQPEAEHEILFLMLIRQTEYTDGLTQRLADAEAQLKAERPGLYQFAYAKYTALLEAATREAVELGTKALERHADSPHFLDYHVYLGDAWRYSALLEMARRDHALSESKQEEADRHATEALADLANAHRENLEIVSFADRWLSPPAESAAPPAEARYDLDTLRKYKLAAMGRISEWKLMLARAETEKNPAAAKQEK